MSEIRHIDLTPTPQGLVQIEAIFRETIKQSQFILEECEERLTLLNTGDYLFEKEEYEDETTFLINAIEAYISQERHRIAKMIDGLHAMGKEEEEEEKKAKRTRRVDFVCEMSTIGGTPLQR